MKLAKHADKMMAETKKEKDWRMQRAYSRKDITKLHHKLGWKNNLRFNCLSLHENPPSTLLLLGGMGIWIAITTSRGETTNLHIRKSSYHSLQFDSLLYKSKVKIEISLITQRIKWKLLKTTRDRRLSVITHLSWLLWKSNSKIENPKSKYTWNSRK